MPTGDKALSDLVGVWQPNGRAGLAAERERLLLLAVLEEAVTCYRRHAHTRGGHGRELFEEAAAWLDSPDRSNVFTFESICDALDLNPEYVRRGLRQWRAQARGPYREPAARPARRPEAIGDGERRSHTVPGHGLRLRTGVATR